LREKTANFLEAFWLGRSSLSVLVTLVFCTKLDKFGGLVGIAVNPNGDGDLARATPPCRASACPCSHAQAKRPLKHTDCCGNLGTVGLKRCVSS
jgi:hypothetical protein